jgi:hypothetical protein
VCLAHHAGGHCASSIQSGHVSRCDSCTARISIGVTSTQNRVANLFLPLLFPSSFTSLHLAVPLLVIWSSLPKFESAVSQINSMS